MLLLFRNRGERGATTRHPATAPSESLLTARYVTGTVYV